MADNSRTIGGTTSLVQHADRADSNRAEHANRSKLSASGPLLFLLALMVFSVLFLLLAPPASNRAATGQAISQPMTVVAETTIRFHYSDEGRVTAIAHAPETSTQIALNTDQQHQIAVMLLPYERLRNQQGIALTEPYHIGVTDTGLTLIKDKTLNRTVNLNAFGEGPAALFRTFIEGSVAADRGEKG